MTTLQRTPKQKNSQSMTNDAKAPPQIFVGIGASAGGLAALKQLIPKLPLDRGCTYILIQHMDPTHKSTLDQILRKDSSVSVEIAVDRARLKSDHLYITPSDKNCAVVDGTLHLEDIRSVGPRHSVDLLLASLAKTHGSAATGIILSGTGVDGLQGAHELKAVEGLVLVQDLNDAEHTGMPAAVIEARLADIIAPAANLGIELSQFIDRGKNTVLNLDAQHPDARTALIHVLLRKTGFAFDQYKDSTLNRRIERRLVVNKLTSLDEYVSFVEHSENEADLLLKDMHISVTGFFRDKEAFKAIAKVIHTLVASKQVNDSLRIWVPGCATGEEAFSIAVLVAEALDHHLGTTDVQIFATDVDTSAITHARKSLYLKTLVDNIPPPLLNKYFEATDGTYRVQKRLRDIVVFAEHNLLVDPPFGRIDFISCRNVLIYFKQAAQERLLNSFHYALQPGGLLVLGPSEGLGSLSDLFDPMNKAARIYVRKDTKRRLPTFGTPVRRRRSADLLNASSESLSVDQQIHEAVFIEYAPASILVDASFDIVHLNGELEPFMRLPQGDITLNVQTLVIDPLRLELRLLLQKMQRDRKLTRTRAIEIVASTGRTLVTLVALPVKVVHGADHTLILFEKQVSIKSAVRDGKDKREGEGEDADFRNYELEQELTATRDHLHTNIKELEISSQELQSVNEEFQSTSEELQASNEEFQTTNEELQSTNEELHTVNEELKSKTDELESTNADLEDILNVVVEGIVLLDADLRVTRYSAGAKRVLDLLPTSIGRPLTTVGGAIDLTVISPDIRAAVKTDKVVERELELGDQFYVVRLIPAADDGLIISFINETERIRVARQSERLATVVRDSNDAITLQDQAGQILAWNRGATQLYGYSEQEALAMNIRQIESPKDEAKAARLISQLMSGQVIGYFEAIRLSKDNRHISVSITATALRDDNGVPYAVATTERDLTEKEELDVQRQAKIVVEKTGIQIRIQRLTPREREVLRLLVAGSADASSRQIGAQLNISARTIDTHRSRIKEKLDVHSILDMVAIAKIAGLYESTSD